MLEKKKSITQIEVTENGHVQVRETTRIFENGKLLSESHHRHALAPGADISEENEKVKKIARIVWDSDVVSTYEQSQVALKNKLGGK